MHPHVGITRHRRTATRLLAALAAVGLAAQTPAWGQVSPTAQPPPPGHETETETITKCLHDFRSPDADMRRRAVLILGKYPGSAVAQQVLGQALHDTEAGVRRAATVAIVEHRMRAPELAAAMLGLLQDPDVHVRRIVSSALPQIVAAYRSPLRRSGLQGSVATPAAMFPLAARQAIRQAFADDDQTVRKNMLTYHSYFLAELEPGALAKLLQDASRDIRILELQAAVRVLPPAEFVEQAQLRVRDPDRLIRLHLARCLVTVEDPAAGDLLDLLRQDQDPEIAAEAASGLLMQQRLDDLDELRRLLGAPGLDERLGARLITLAGIRLTDALTLLNELAHDSRPAYRAAALNGLARRYADAVSVADLLEHLGDPAPDVRQAAANIIYRHPGLAPDRLLPLVLSPHQDVREVIVRASRRMTTETAAPLLAELLFDAADPVRQQVIAEMARRRVPGWLDVLTRALDDGSPEIRQTAVYVLATCPEPEAQKALDELARRTDDDQLRALILSRRRSSRPAPLRQHAPPEAQRER